MCKIKRRENIFTHSDTDSVQHKAVYIRRSGKVLESSELILSIFFSGNFADKSRHEYWKPVLKISHASIEDSERRAQRLHIVRILDIHKKKVDYIRFTRAYEKNEAFFYLNGEKIDFADLPLLAERIYERRSLRKKYGKSTQLDETAIITYMGDRIIDIDFPTEINPEVLNYGKPKFTLLDNAPIFTPKKYGAPMRRRRFF